MKMCFFAFPPCNDPSCSCPQTSRTTRGPFERQCAVLNHFPDPMCSELERSWRRRPAEMDRCCSRSSLAAEQGQARGWRVPGGECSAFPGELLPGASAGPSSCRTLLWQQRLTQVLPPEPLLSALLNGNTLQCSALHLKNLWVKHSLKSRGTNPFFIFRGLEQYPNICL